MYSTKSKDFAYDVKQLVLSLGGFAYIQECMRNLNGGMNIDVIGKVGELQACFP